MRDVFLVGLGYEHHARHSGYGGFARYVGVWLEPPISSRHRAGRIGRRLERAVVAATRESTDSLSVFLAEGAAALHMSRRRRALYHVLQADRDLWLLGRIARRREHALVATFHKPASSLRQFEDRQRRLVADLDAVVLVAGSQRAYFEDLLPAERLHVVPLGVDTEFFRPSERDERRGRHLCVTVGAHLRDWDTLVEAVRLVGEANPRVDFLAVGTEGSSPRSIPLRAAPRAGIHLMPRLSDCELRRLYRRASLALFSYRDATASTALLEAMACGLPIVATRVGGIPEYLPSEAGILCPVGDASALARATLALVEDGDLAARLGGVARATALRYDYAEVAAGLRAVYASLD